MFSSLITSLKLLIKLWITRAFWKKNAIHTIPVLFGILFWWRVTASVLNGAPPLLAWMILAYSSVWISSILTWRIFSGITDDTKRYGPAMLLLQLAIILVANTFVIMLMIARGVQFVAGDVWIAASVGVCLAVLSPFIATGRIGPKSDWAMCVYSVSLKSAPQLVQALWLFRGFATLDIWGCLFLFGQGFSRWLISRGMKKHDPTSTKTRAQYINATVDLLTIVAILGGAAYALA